MSWSTDDEAFEEKVVDIFNDGKAGEVFCTGSIVPKGPDDKEKSPDWKIVFTDENGKSANIPIWTAEPEQSENDWKKAAAKKVIRNLQHIIRYTIGESYLANLPKATATYKELVDLHINLLNANGFANGKYYVFATYGTTDRDGNVTDKNKYIGIRSYPKFIRQEDGDVMTANDIDVMERFQADATSVGSEPEMAGGEASSTEWPA